VVGAEAGARDRPDLPADPRARGLLGRAALRAAAEGPARPPDRRRDGPDHEDDHLEAQGGRAGLSGPSGRGRPASPVLPLGEGFISPAACVHGRRPTARSCCRSSSATASVALRPRHGDGGPGGAGAGLDERVGALADAMGEDSRKRPAHEEGRRDSRPRAAGLPVERLHGYRDGRRSARPRRGGSDQGRGPGARAEGGRRALRDAGSSDAPH